MNKIITKHTFVVSFFFIMALIANITGPILLKLFTAAEKNIFLIIVFITLLSSVYFIRIISWLMLGKWYQLSYIYPLLSINYIFSFILGMIIFKEDYTNSKFIGSLIITLGVYVISRTPYKKEYIDKASSGNII